VAAGLELLLNRTPPHCGARFILSQSGNGLDHVARIPRSRTGLGARGPAFPGLIGLNIYQPGTPREILLLEGPLLYIHIPQATVPGRAPHVEQKAVLAISSVVAPAVYQQPLAGKLLEAGKGQVFQFHRPSAGKSLCGVMKKDRGTALAQASGREFAQQRAGIKQV
jgi:hypothetical protein